jgi:hypothetical protein
MALFSAISLFVASVLVSVGVGAAAAAAIGSFVVRSIAAAAVSLISRALAPKPQVPRQDLQATISQEAGPRTRLYGRGLLGGTRAFWESLDGKLYMVLLLNHGALTERLAVWFGGRVINLAPEGAGWRAASGQGSGYVYVEYRDGSADGGDYDLLQTAFPDLWTADHRLANQATLLARFTAPSGVQFNKAFPGGHNTQVQVEAKGVPVLDVRSNVSGYHDNAGLCVYDYFSCPDGYAIPKERINAASFAAFADLCDEAVPLKTGGTEPRYRLWGAHALTESPKAVLERMALTCDAQVYQDADGKVSVMGGQYRAPDFTLTDDDIFSLEVQDGDNAMDGFNVLKGTFLSADHDYQDTEAEAWENTEALLTHAEKAESMEADMVPSHAQMRRLMKIKMGRLNRRWTGTLVTNLVGIKARFPMGEGLHVIRVQYSELEMDEPVEVLSHTIEATQGAGGVLIWRCKMTVGSVDPEWFDWDPETEEGSAPPVPEKADDEETPVPVIETLSEVIDGGLRHLRAEIADIGRADLELEMQFKKDAAQDWQPMTESGRIAESGSVLAATTYEVRARFDGGDWSQVSAIQTGA